METSVVWQRRYLTGISSGAAIYAAIGAKELGKQCTKNNGERYYHYIHSMTNDYKLIFEYHVLNKKWLVS